jgi:hypothetical protein
MLPKRLVTKFYYQGGTCRYWEMGFRHFKMIGILQL